MQFIDLKSQYQAYQTEIDTEIASVLNRSQYIMGPTLKELEVGLADYVGVKHAIGCSSGTDALLLALMAIDLEIGDEVITCPYTFIATAEVISLLRAKPVFVDVDPETYNIDPSLIEAAITSKTKAIMPVSLFGEVADMEAINQIAKKHNLPVIEDAAQSFGAIYNGKKSTNLSTMATTSFYPAKPLGGFGDGGAIFTNDDELEKKIRILLNHGQDQVYQHRYVGINGRLDDLQAAVLKVKLKYLDQELTRRNQIAENYQNINSEKFSAQKLNPQGRSAWAQYSLTIKSDKLNRETVMNSLKEQGIPCNIYYPIPLHRQKVFSYLGHQTGDFPISEKLSEIMFSLPIHPFMKDEEAQTVVKALNQF